MSSISFLGRDLLEPEHDVKVVTEVLTGPTLGQVELFFLCHHLVELGYSMVSRMNGTQPIPLSAETIFRFS